MRGGVHQVAYARALERLTGADLMKLFPSPRIPTDLIPECQPHIQRGEHLKLYRFSPGDYQELAAVFNGPHPETGEALHIATEVSPERAPPFDLPSQPALFAPSANPAEISEIAQQLRERAGLPKHPTGVVAHNGGNGGCHQQGQGRSQLKPGQPMGVAPARAPHLRGAWAPSREADRRDVSKSRP